ncbi:hypothetical protein GQF01_02015 [Paenibacillus sp. 5J-6]|uniref:Uncharacterized protein n=1 Tax=Paenibacillus silvestris TaxID=2606219 RepID=A0A6L8US92_9BACL|nr:hypothetical protein [Paenibacillus silvestris]MZQ80915.1 hypothetical protein [Paenibacillus silvestris]
MEKMTFTYRDPKYNFSIDIPTWWKKYIVIRTHTPPGNSYNVIYDVTIDFKYKGKVYISPYSLLVFKMSLKKWREGGYDNSYYKFITSQRGLIFAGNVPSEPPSEFLKQDGSDYDYKKYGTPLRLLSRMVNEDVPKINKSFRFD